MPPRARWPGAAAAPRVSREVQHQSTLSPRNMRRTKARAPRYPTAPHIVLRPAVGGRQAVERVGGGALRGGAGGATSSRVPRLPKNGQARAPRQNMAV